MQKAESIDISTTNIANFGTEIERKIKEASANSEAAWHVVGQDVSLWVWRIEKFQVVPVAKEAYGKFFDGDSYIVLKAYKATPDAEKLSYNAHFWLGAETTLDEAGTAAYKTVELDTFLHDAAVQYREIQGHESDLFLYNFKEIQILHGGVESGFRQVVSNAEAVGKLPLRLLQVKGKPKSVVARQVAAKSSSLNAGDVFILDKGNHIIQWNGRSASAFEKAKGAQVAQSVAGERMGKAKVSVIDQERTVPETNEFFEALGGSATDPVAEPTPDTPVAKRPTALYRLSDVHGVLSFELVKSKGVQQSDLKSEDAFIVDGGYRIVVWIGKNASAEEKKNGVAFAERFLDDQKRSKLAQIVRVVDGGDCEFLKELYRD
ncbi:fragmin60 [Blastocladiella britannica]|nr:fragmin60 [Blastocladiella britannica]